MEPKPEYPNRDVERLVELPDPEVEVILYDGAGKYWREGISRIVWSEVLNRFVVASPKVRR